jgi:hypothetical protein
MKCRMLGERKQPCASDHLDLESPRSNRNLSSVLGAITHFGPPAPNDTIHDSFFDIGRFDVYKPYLAGYQTSFPGGGSTSEIVLRYTLDDCAFLLDRLFERYKSIHGRASLDNHSQHFRQMVAGRSPAAPYLSCHHLHSIALLKQPPVD